MRKNLILTIDQGTTGSTALLMNVNGRILGSENTPFPQIFPKKGWVEHCPYKILKSVRSSIKKVLEKTKSSPNKILSIGITNQRETVVFWDRLTGKPIGNALVWQCRRTAKKTNNLKNSGHEKWIKDKTGLSLDPYFSSTKIEWFLKNKRKKNNLCIGTIDSFLIWQLTGGKSFLTEPSNASRTQLFNLKTQSWDEELLKFFSVKKDYLPQVVDSNSVFGEVKNFAPLIKGTPITGVLGDQQASLFGHGAFKKGELKCTYGTGSFILLNTGSKKVKSRNGLLTTVSWKLKDEDIHYALEGGAFNCASALNWVKDELGVFSDLKEFNKIVDKVDSSKGVLFAPTFSGLGAPYWSPQSLGAFIGLSRDVKKEHLCLSLLEGLAFQNDLIFKSLKKDTKESLKTCFVDGGVSKSNKFMEIQSQVSGLKLIRPKNIESTAIGASYVAALGAGVISKKEDIQTFKKIDRVFQKKTGLKTKKLIKSYETFFKALRKTPFLKEDL